MKYSKTEASDNNTLINALKGDLFQLFKMLENFIEICPVELWNTEKNGYVFCDCLDMLLGIMKSSLLDKKFEKKEKKKVKISKITPELTKEYIKNLYQEVKIISENWFNDKDDNWLKIKTSGDDKLTCFDITISLIKEMTYFIGFYSAIFKEYGIITGENYEYL